MREKEGERERERGRMREKEREGEREKGRMREKEREGERGREREREWKPITDGMSLKFEDHPAVSAFRGCTTHNSGKTVT